MPVTPRSVAKTVKPSASWGEPSVLVRPVRLDPFGQHVLLGKVEVSSACARVWRKVQLCFVVQRRSVLHVHVQGLLRRLLPAGLSPITLWRGGNTASQGTNRQEGPAGEGDRFVRHVSKFCTCIVQVVKPALCVAPAVEAGEMLRTVQELKEHPQWWFDVCVIRNYKSSWR